MHETSIPSSMVSQHPFSQFLRHASFPHRIFIDICAGPHTPLSSAVCNLGFDSCPLDSRLNVTHDLLDSRFYEDLLRLCASGTSAYTAASPPCNEFSLLKAKPNGPKPIRTLEFPLGLPNLTQSEERRLTDSREILHRSVMCLQATACSGGDGHLEQPPGALSWEDPQVQLWTHHKGSHCVSIAACAHGLDFSRSWLFASTFEPIRQLASICPPHHVHQDFAGVQLPDSLAQTFAQIVSPLFSEGHGNTLNIEHALQLIPTKTFEQPPHANVDGGGRFSVPDWSGPQISDNLFQQVRNLWTEKILATGLHHSLIQHFRSHATTPPFPLEVIRGFRDLFEFGMREYVSNWDWSIRADQPMCLKAMQSTALAMNDLDVELWPQVLAGVNTGFRNDIPPSQVFAPRADNEPKDFVDLSVHMCNWKSAEDEPGITSSLVQEELAQGWIEPFHGSLADAQAHFPLGVGIGRLGLALSPHRPPRLVLDSSVCGTNGRCTIPDKQTMPSVLDVARSFPLRSNDTIPHQSAFTLDIKSAHKRIVVAPDQRGLLGFWFSGTLYFYKVCPFGAIFAQHFWGRMGSFILRFFHALIFVRHSLFLFVDDFLLSQEHDVLPLYATMVCIACQMFQIPISWKKCVLHHTIVWIGWQFDFKSGLIQLEKAKITKLQGMIERLTTSSRVSKKDLEKFVGLCMWCTSIFPALKAQLHWLYSDLFSIPATLYSISPAHWYSVQDSLDQTCKFTQVPIGTRIPLGSTLVSVKHVAITSPSDLSKVPITDHRVWMRIRNPLSTSRRLSQDSFRVLSLFQQWLQGEPPMVSMRPHLTVHCECAADAWASGPNAGIGGFLMLGGQIHWFHIAITVDDLRSLGLEVESDLQKHISFLEALAQYGLLSCFVRKQHHLKFNLILPALSDNTGAESRVNSLFSTKRLMSQLMERISLFATKFNILLDVSHISGFENSLADSLSRWDDQLSSLPKDVSPENRIPFQLVDLWHLDTGPKLYPSTASVRWIR